LAVLVLVAVGGQVEAAGGGRGAGGGATGLNRSSDLRARHANHVNHRERDLGESTVRLTPWAGREEEEVLGLLRGGGWGRGGERERGTREGRRRAQAKERNGRLRSFLISSQRDFLSRA